MHRSDSLTLEPAGLYRNVCRRVIRDGVVSEDERKLLDGLRRILGIGSTFAAELLSQAMEDAGTPTAREAPLALEEIYRAACSLAWMDDALEEQEVRMLEGLARALKLEAAQARAILEEVRYLNEASRR